jgi:hypothetical protein
MPKKPPKLRPDVAETAYRTMLEATGQAPKTPPPGERAEKNPAAVERGRKGGKKGGRSRQAGLTPQERTLLARKASLARWQRGSQSSE